MRILQVTNFFKPSFESGGVARVAYNLSKNLSSRGHEITVFTTNKSLRNIKVKTNKPIYFEGMNVYYFENLRRYFSSRIPPIPYYLFFIARKKIRDFDVIHIHEHRTLLAIITHHYAKKYDIPYFLQAHGSIAKNIGKTKRKNIYDYLFGNKILADAEKLIAVSSVETDQYAQLGFSDENITTIPNGVDIGLSGAFPEKGSFRRKFKITSKLIILYVGRIHERKGLEFLVRSYAMLKQEMNDVTLILAGSDAGYKNQIIELISELNIEENIIFTNHLTEYDKIAAYIDSDVLVYPSTLEIFGLVPFEAIMCGTPVIVTDDCGCGELVKKAKCGLLVKYGSTIDLKEKLKYILLNSEIRSEFVRNGQKYINENLLWKSITIQMEALYEASKSE